MHSSRERMKRRKPVKQEQAAMADQAPEGGTDFDILQHDHTDQPFSEPTGSRGRELADHQPVIGRALKPHAKRMAMQAAPDHGDHQ
jgi:hypothetical protein